MISGAAALPENLFSLNAGAVLELEIIDSEIVTNPAIPNASTAATSANPSAFASMVRSMIV